RINPPCFCHSKLARANATANARANATANATASLPWPFPFLKNRIKTFFLSYCRARGAKTKQAGSFARFGASSGRARSLASNRHSQATTRDSTRGRHPASPEAVSRHLPRPGHGLPIAAPNQVDQRPPADPRPAVELGSPLPKADPRGRQLARSDRLRRSAAP